MRKLKSRLSVPDGVTAAGQDIFTVPLLSRL
jgi:hypothetical protein